jgi:hypothetical protein
MPWTSPLTRSGKSALVPDGPWTYAMDVIAVHSKGEAERINESIPDNMESDGQLWFYFADIVSQTPVFPELNYLAPGLVQYKEAAVFVKVEYNGKSFAYCPFMYVDNDLSLMRGFAAGFPKKLAAIDITRNHVLLPQTKLGGVASRAGYTLLQMIVEPDKEVNKLPLDDFGPWLLKRYLKTTNTDELVIFQADMSYGTIKKGKAEIRVSGGINDELHIFEPTEIIAGYFYTVLIKSAEIRIVSETQSRRSTGGTC